MKVVVIGASAGGSKALAELLRYLPASFPLPIIVVKHHRNGDGNEMAEWLNRRVALDVHFAEDKEPLAAGTVIVAPPDYHLLLDQSGMVELSLDEPVVYARPSLDVLFETAALAFGDQTMCVVLTGASRDGALGAEAIRKAGGTVYVQNPDTAEVSVMPRAALGKNEAAHAMELNSLATKLLGFANE